MHGVSHDAAAEVLRKSFGSARLLVSYNPSGYNYLTQLVARHEEELERDPAACRHVPQQMIPVSTAPQVRST